MVVRDYVMIHLAITAVAVVVALVAQAAMRP
jgi:hypothetical protein